MIAAFVVAFIAGAVAAVSGFGIGTLLTPLFALAIGPRLAVALASLPHLAGTAARFITLRQHADKRLLMSFGALSLFGALGGALLNTVADASLLAIVVGALVIIVGVTAIVPATQNIRLGRGTAWIAGALSGFFGGFVGNQGGIRSAALLGFPLSKEAFVATATALGLIVDAARIPIYLMTYGSDMLALGRIVVSALLGVLIGTAAGSKLLHRLPAPAFRRFVGVALVLLGVYVVTAELITGTR